MLLINAKLTIYLVIVTIKSILAVQTFTNDRFLFSKNSRFRPLVTKTFDQLIYVTFSSDPEQKIKFETEKISYEPYEISFPVLHEIENPLSIDSLADGKIVLSVFCNVENTDHIVLTFIVDLEKRQYSIISTAVDYLPINSQQSIIVLTGEKEFDIFLTNHINCTDNQACRLKYNAETGDLISITNFDWPKDVTDWTINSIDEKEFSKGYFYTMFVDDKTIIQRLDQNLQVQNELILDKTFLFSNIYGSINRCRGISNHELECQLFNDKLEKRLSATIDTNHYKSFIRKFKLFNLSDGSALVFIVMQIYTEKTTDNEFTTYLHHVDLYGRVNGPIKFQDNVCKDVDDIGIIKMKERFFCINISCQNIVRIKCINLI